MKAEATKMGRGQRRGMKFLQGDTSFVYLLTCMAGYAHAFRPDYHVSSLDTWISDIVHDMICSEFWSSDSGTSCVGCVRGTRLVLEQIAVLPLVKKLSNENAGTKN